jgi:hypothetical protein
MSGAKQWYAIRRFRGATSLSSGQASVISLKMRRVNWRSRAGRSLKLALATALIVLPLDWAGWRGRVTPYDEPRTLFQVLIHFPIVLAVGFLFFYWVEGAKGKQDAKSDQ